ncbi:hypothetical protein Pelo_9969 [Pelomyxa schiedti]|nr:hypothetical protein Pelo_9969 [Pelomyxa schiedti]
MHRKKTTPIPRTPPPKEPSSSSSESESESGNQSNSDHDISNHQTAAKHCLSTPRKEVVEILFPSSGDDSETSDSPPAPNPKRRKKSSVTKNSSKVTSKKNECADSDSDTPKSPPSPQVKPKRPTKPRSHRTRKSVMPSSPSHETWKDIPICHSIPIGSELRDFLLKYPYQRKVPARKRQSCIGVETPTDPNAGHKIVFRFSSPDTPTEESVIPALKTKTSSSGLIFLRRGKAQQDPLPRHCDKLLIVMLGTAEISIQGRGTTKLFPHDQVSVPSGSHFTIQNTPRTKLCKVAYVYRNTTGS